MLSKAQMWKSQRLFSVKILWLQFGICFCEQMLFIHNGDVAFMSF